MMTPNEIDEMQKQSEYESLQETVEQLKNKENRENMIIKALEDITMCLKRISDFLSDKGYRETRKYIDRLEYDLEQIKEEIWVRQMK